MAGLLRCSRVARADGYLPAGSVGASRAFVLVEAPLPWPADVGAHPLLAPLAPVIGGAGARLQAVVPQADRPPGETRVVVYRRPPGGFVRFDRAERSVPTDDLATAIADLLVAPAEPSAPFPVPPPPEPPLAPAPDGVPVPGEPALPPAPGYARYCTTR